MQPCEMRHLRISRSFAAAQDDKSMTPGQPRRPSFPASGRFVPLPPCSAGLRRPDIVVIREDSHVLLLVG